MAMKLKIRRQPPVLDAQGGIVTPGVITTFKVLNPNGTTMSDLTGLASSVAKIEHVFDSNGPSGLGDLKITISLSGVEIDSADNAVP